MTTTLRTTRALTLACAGLLLSDCSKSGGGGGSAGVAGSYESVDAEGAIIELKADGGIVESAPGMGSSTGTYVVDGEKIVMSIDNTTRTFIRDGDCITEPNLGKMCKGGKAGGEANVTTRDVPATPTGTWVATNDDGEFTLEFRPESKLTLSVKPASGTPETQEGTFIVEGDQVHVMLSSQGIPLELKYVNEAYESTSFGPAMRFVKKD